MKTINEIAKTQVFFITGGAIGFFVLNFEIENIIASHIILTIGYLNGFYHSQTLKP